MTNVYRALSAVDHPKDVKGLRKRLPALSGLSDPDVEQLFRVFSRDQGVSWLSTDDKTLAKFEVWLTQ